MGRKGGNRGNYNDQGFSQPQSSGQGWGSGYRQPAQQPQQSSRQGVWGSGFAGNAPAGQNRFGALANSNTQHSGNAQQASPARGGRQEVGWRKAVEEDLLGPWQMWPLSCYAHTATNPGPVKNDVEGAEMSMEELRWQDLQALRAGQSGQALQQAFQAAATQQKQLYQALARADKPPTLGGPPLSPAAFGGGGLKPGRLEGRLGPPSGFGTPSDPQTPGSFGQAPANAPKGFGNSAFGTPATPTQPTPVFGQAASQQPPAFGNQPASGFGAPAVVGQAPAFGQPSAVGSQSTSVFGGGSANQTPAFGASSAKQAPAFGSGSTTQASAFGGQSASAFGTGAFGSSTGFGGGGAFGSQPQKPSPFGGAAGNTTFGAGAQPATAFGKPAGTFGSGAAPITFGNPTPSNSSQGAPVFGAAANQQSPFAGNPAGPINQSGPFQARTDPAQVPSAFGAAGNAAAPSQGASGPSNGSPWSAQFFERGKIPDDPPPVEVCG